MMLDRLRDRAAQILAESRLCTLATTGPAGIQASMVQYSAREITLYLLVPATSDHLFNLELEPEVAVTTPTWHLRGRALIDHAPPDLFSVDQRQWHTVIRITPVRLHIQPEQGPVHHAETIDFDLEF